MCGIAGFRGEGDGSQIEKMLAKMIHRGPDEGGWQQVEPGLFLGMRRLSILDTPGGHQPMFSPDHKHVLVFNGEIYNHESIRRQLTKNGFIFQSDHSDTETLLNGLVHWGLDVLPKLNGMWAFAWWDATKRCLTMCRDRFGKKPLYYWHRDQELVFGSELQVVRTHPAVGTDLDREALVQYFGFGYIPAPKSLIAGVQKLPAGHLLQFWPDTGTLQVKSYAFFDESDRIQLSAPEAWPDQACQLLDRAVQRRFLSDRPVGVFLSGGLDSSSLVALASRQNRGRLKTFSIGFDEPSFDESAYAQAVATHFGTEHHSAQFSSQDALQVTADVVRTLDEPMADASILPMYCLCQLAVQHVTVALGGDGADEWLGGYDPFRALRLAQGYARLVPHWAHRLIQKSVDLLPVSHANMSLDFRLKRTLRGLAHPAERWLPVWMAPLEPKQIAMLTGIQYDPFASAVQHWHQTPGDLFEKTRSFYLQYYLQDDILTKVDRASMRHSLEVRAPFLDRDWVDFVGQLSRQAWFRGSTSKRILRQAMAELLPKAVLKRPKKGFGVPIGRWFREKTLQLPLESLQGVIDTQLASDLQNRHQKGQSDERAFLWAAYLLGHWLKHR
ncbi:MAG: asparagine synthase (glutamine-hydrolyzing) [Acidobacteria bacterium]|nr:asparagine synthase (glutamine-hydrolyzing) [Acidobacteriota bacterium]